MKTFCSTIKNVFVVLSVVTIMLFCGETLLFSQGMTSGKGKITGIVTDQDTGKPIPGVTIKLNLSNLKLTFEPSPVTDADGKWKAVYISEALWDLDFIKEGYETQKISFKVTRTPAVIETKLKKASGMSGLNQDALKDIESAKGLIAQQKYDDALALLLKIDEKLKNEPGTEIINLYIGNAYSAKGDYAKAIEFYKKSLEKFPNNKELILSIASAYSNLNDSDSAMVWTNKLAIEDINNVDMLYNVGVIYFNKNDLPNALKYFKKSIEIDPNFADGYYQLGLTYTSMDQQKEAVEALKKFLELAPNSSNADSAKAVLDAFKGK
ncbi:MAG: tetratricopeptide repeat protein [Candidatus Omnitrophota bacterium]